MFYFHECSITNRIANRFPQIEACNNEAIRLETMIRLKNVRIQTDLVMSTILGAQTSPANITYRTGNTALLFKTNNLFIIFIPLIVTCAELLFLRVFI